MNGPADRRVLALDGLRGLAISLVLLHHFLQRTSAAPPLIDRIAFGVAESGWVGVDLFFVLSGFLITGILYDAKGSPRYFRDFYTRRTLRIFPLYYAALFVFFVALPLVPHPFATAYVSDSSPDQAWFWTYLTNFRIAERGTWYDHLVPTVFWSLAIEEQFYLVWPLLVLSFTRRTLMRLCLALFGIAFGVRVVLALLEVSPVSTFVLTPARMDCLVLGALLALIQRDEDAFRRTVRGAVWAAPLLGLILIALSWPHTRLDWRDPLTTTIGFSAVAAFSGCVLALSAAAPSGAVIRRLFESAPLRVLGQYSYAMYIFHGPSGTLVKQIYGVEQVPRVFGSELPFTVVYTVSATLVTLLVAWLSWHLFERHFLRHQRGHRGAPARSGRSEDAGIAHDVAAHASR